MQIKFKSKRPARSNGSAFAHLAMTKWRWHLWAGASGPSVDQRGQQLLSLVKFQFNCSNYMAHNFLFLLWIFCLIARGKKRVSKS